MRLFISGKMLVIASFMGFSLWCAAANADALLKSYDIEGVDNYGGIRKFHEDARGVYYFGTVKWKDPKWDSDFTVSGVFAFMKPQGKDSLLINGTETDATLHSVKERVFRLAETDATYFNRILTGPLRTAFPKLLPDPRQNLHMRGYALNVHFIDSKTFAKARIDHHIIPEEPLFQISWTADGSGGYAPWYQVAKQAGIPVLGGWPRSEDNRKFWTTLASARGNLTAKGTQAAASGSTPIAQLYQEYETRKAAREAKAEKARHDAAADYLKRKAAAGTVYRNSDFWNRFDRSHTIRLIFDGEFNRMDDPFEAAAVYVGYVDAFYDVCERYLPRQRARYTTQRFIREGDGPWIPDGNPQTLYMDPAYYPKYAQMLDAAGDGMTLKALEAIFGPFDGKTQRTLTAQDVLSRLFQSSAEIFRRDAVLRAFMTEAGCSSQTVHQLGDRLLDIANGRAAGKGKNSKRATESDAVLTADIDRELDLRRREAEDALRYRAAHPQEGPDGWQLAHESLLPYRVDRLGNEEAYRRNRDYRHAVNALQERRQPVLQCRYGPTGLNGELETWRNWNFWYARIPAEAEAVALIDGTTQKGLSIAVSACPLSTGAVEGLLH